MVSKKESNEKPGGLLEDSRLHPIGTRIIVRPLKPQEMTPGGIALPSPPRNAPCKGIVVATGMGRLMESGECITLEVEVGHRITYESNVGIEIDHEGEKLIVIQESDVLYYETEE